MPVNTCGWGGGVCHMPVNSCLYLLNFSSKVSGLVLFVLHPCGGGTPIGCGSAFQLFLVSHSHELHMCSGSWSLPSFSLLCCWACCGGGLFCPQKFDLEYVGLN